MRTERLNPREFFNAMKKKPALQAILDSFDNYTTEQLDTISGQPLWIRTILVEMKNEEALGIVDDDSAIRAEEIANMMMANTVPLRPVKYEVREWVGNDWWMSCGITGTLLVEVIYGDYMYIINCDVTIDKFLVGMGSSVGILTREQWYRFLNSTKMVGTMTKPEYAAFVSERLGRNFVDRDEVARTAGPNSYVEPTKERFTIVRHDVK